MHLEKSIKLAEIEMFAAKNASPSGHPSLFPTFWLGLLISSSSRNHVKRGLRSAYIHSLAAAGRGLKCAYMHDFCCGSKCVTDIYHRRGLLAD